MPTPRRGHFDKRRQSPHTKPWEISSVLTFEPGQASVDRHLDRLRVNLEYRAEVEQWCREHGWRVEITEEGHHWYFRRGGTFCEWRPSMKTFYVSRRPLRDRQVLDYRQCLSILEQYTR